MDLTDAMVRRMSVSAWIAACSPKAVLISTPAERVRSHYNRWAWGQAHTAIAEQRKDGMLFDGDMVHVRNLFERRDGRKQPAFIAAIYRALADGHHLA